MPNLINGTVYSPCAPAFHGRTIFTPSFLCLLLLPFNHFGGSLSTVAFPFFPLSLSFLKPVVLRFKIITVFNLARASLIKLLSIIFYLVHLSTSPAPSLILPFLPKAGWV